MNQLAILRACKRTPQMLMRLYGTAAFDPRAGCWRRLRRVQISVSFRCRLVLMLINADIDGDDQTVVTLCRLLDLKEFTQRLYANAPGAISENDRSKE